MTILRTGTGPMELAGDGRKSGCVRFVNDRLLFDHVSGLVLDLHHSSQLNVQPIRDWTVLHPLLCRNRESA